MLTASMGWWLITFIALCAPRSLKPTVIHLCVCPSNANGSAEGGANLALHWLPADAGEYFKRVLENTNGMKHGILIESFCCKVLNALGKGDCCLTNAEQPQICTRDESHVADYVKAPKMSQVNRLIFAFNCGQTGDCSMIIRKWLKVTNKSNKKQSERKLTPWSLIDS